MTFLTSGVDRSGSAGLGSTLVVAANSQRRGLTFQNLSDHDMWLTETDRPAEAGVGYRVIPFESFSVSTCSAIHVFTGVASAPFAATEY